MTGLNNPQPANTSVQRLAFTVMEAVAALGVGRSLLYRLIKDKQIRVAKIGGRTLIPVQELEALLVRNGGIE